MIKYNILGINISGLTKEAVLNIIENTIQKNDKLQISTVNNEFILEAQKNISFAATLNKTLVIADSAGVVWAVKHIYGKKIEKIAGADLACDICKLSASHGFRIFLLGGEKNVAKEARNNLLKQYGKLQIVGTIDGVEINPEKKDLEIESAINKSRPNIIFVGLGAPKQELWIEKNILNVSANVFIGLGGTLDFMSGKIKRAPTYLRYLNLEWLYRLAHEPRRIRRIFNAVVIFPIKVIFWRRWA